MGGRIAEYRGPRSEQQTGRADDQQSARSCDEKEKPQEMVSEQHFMYPANERRQGGKDSKNPAGREHPGQRASSRSVGSRDPDTGRQADQQHGDDRRRQYEQMRGMIIDDLLPQRARQNQKK